MPSKKRIVPFVVLAAPRTGSNMLCSLLHSHPDVLCHHELYNPNGIFYALDLRETAFSIGNMTLEKRNQKPLEFLNLIWQHQTEGVTHLGFKMTHYQQKDVFHSILNDRSIKKIILHREDQIATYLSKEIALARNIWEDYGNQPSKPKNFKIRFSHHNLEREIRYNKSYYGEINKRLRATHQEAFYIAYESLKKPEMHSELLKFLGCREHLLTTRTNRQNPEPWSLLVENYTEMNKYLATQRRHSITNPAQIT